MKIRHVICVVLFGLLATAYIAYMNNGNKWKYEYWSNGTDDWIVHRFSSEIVVKPHLINYDFESGYIYGIRLPSLRWECKTERKSIVTRHGSKPYFFVLDLSKGPLFEFDQTLETPIEFDSREEFEQHLEYLNLSEYTEFDYSVIEEWQDILEERYNLTFYKECFGE